MSIYTDLTKEFNAGKVRTILSSGQAVVLHNLAIVSKDGDWIVREEEDSLEFVLNILASHQAQYRFGAPLDLRWLKGGWSSHFEFFSTGLRIRTDFVSRPPRLNPEQLKKLWAENENASQGTPFLEAKSLAEIKKTMREKDYPVIGELARLLVNPLDQLLLSRSARDIIELSEKYPEAFEAARKVRPLLNNAEESREVLEEALDHERRQLMREDEERLLRYEKAAQGWIKVWPMVLKKISGQDLITAHKLMIEEALRVLPFEV